MEGISSGVYILYGMVEMRFKRIGVWVYRLVIELWVAFRIYNIFCTYTTYTARYSIVHCSYIHM